MKQTSYIEVMAEDLNKLSDWVKARTLENDVVELKIVDGLCDRVSLFIDDREEHEDNEPFVYDEQYRNIVG